MIGPRWFQVVSIAGGTCRRGGSGDRAQRRRRLRAARAGLAGDRPLPRDPCPLRRPAHTSSPSAGSRTDSWAARASLPLVALPLLLLIPLAPLLAVMVALWALSEGLRRHPRFRGALGHPALPWVARARAGRRVRRRPGRPHGETSPSWSARDASATPPRTVHNQDVAGAEQTSERTGETRLGRVPAVALLVAAAYGVALVVAAFTLPVYDSTSSSSSGRDESGIRHARGRQRAGRGPRPRRPAARDPGRRVCAVAALALGAADRLDAHRTARCRQPARHAVRRHLRPAGHGRPRPGLCQVATDRHSHRRCFPRRSGPVPDA